MDIRISNLSFSYPEKLIFEDFDITFFENKINVVLGSSGVGKTTLLDAITGLKKVSGNILGVPDKISYIFQEDRLIKNISVYRNLELVIKDIYKDKTERKNKIDEMLALLEIGELGKRLPLEISGGQAQRVQMARAFLYPSKLLILDEPFKGLDVSLKTRLINKFLDLWEREKRTVIMVTHDVYEALLMGDNINIISGNPAKTILSMEIQINKKERSLTSPEITKYRDEIVEKII